VAVLKLLGNSYILQTDKINDTKMQKNEHESKFAYHKRFQKDKNLIGVISA
jgi:hypothetical protein